MPLQSRTPLLRTSLFVPLIGFTLAFQLFNALGCAAGEAPGDNVSLSTGPALSSQPPSQSPPLRPVEPPNPATHRPPMDNPGGVNRDRPPRPVPGLE